MEMRKKRDWLCVARQACLTLWLNREKSISYFSLASLLTSLFCCCLFFFGSITAVFSLYLYLFFHLIHEVNAVHPLLRIKLPKTFQLPRGAIVAWPFSLPTLMVQTRMRGNCRLLLGGFNSANGSGTLWHLGSV